MSTENRPDGLKKTAAVRITSAAAADVKRAFFKKTENSESKHDIAADDINHGQCGFTYSHFGSIIIMHGYSSKDLKTKELNRGMSIEV